MNSDQVRGTLMAQFPDAQVEVEGSDGKFRLTLISDRFAGLSRVKRQQLVYAAIGQAIADGSVHAVTMTTLTPEEWHVSGH